MSEPRAEIPIAGAGTSEATWRPFLDGLGLRPMVLEPPVSATVVAPHPDDEILGVGGLLALLAAAGTRIEVLAVTDGEASHPGGSLGPAQLAPLRAKETVAALRRLGIASGVRRLRLPDGGRDALEQPVVEALRMDPGCWLLGPWEGDGHPDHEAVGRGCGVVARRDGARLLSYPVWAWHWATPGDDRLPWERARRIDLPPMVLAAKAGAVAEFGTQIRPLGPLPQDAPVLPEAILQRFARPFEVVFE